VSFTEGDTRQTFCRVFFGLALGKLAVSRGSWSTAPCRRWIPLGRRCGLGSATAWLRSIRTAPWFSSSTLDGRGYWHMIWIMGLHALSTLSQMRRRASICFSRTYRCTRNRRLSVSTNKIKRVHTCLNFGPSRWYKICLWLSRYFFYATSNMTRGVRPQNELERVTRLLKISKPQIVQGSRHCSLTNICWFILLGSTWS
jgi:hypothetical protein